MNILATSVYKTNLQTSDYRRITTRVEKTMQNVSIAIGFKRWDLEMLWTFLQKFVKNKFSAEQFEQQQFWLISKLAAIATNFLTIIVNKQGNAFSKSKTRSKWYKATCFRVIFYVHLYKYISKGQIPADFIKTMRK